ncbi:MAG: STAS domain-containing protein [Thermoguttaceae bacterium]|nr:STAS domain-containing protein [Thermoguttaceae bacterium]MDW8039020.1 STAS domain-containing protein [Thermoguttaceae bacterium]
MNLPTEVFGEVVVVHAPEEFGADQAPAVLAYLTGQAQSRVVLDLDNTEFLDSAGLEALLDAQDRLRELGGELKIAVANPVNRKILEITRLDRHLEVFDNVLDAVKSFR